MFISSQPNANTVSISLCLICVNLSLSFHNSWPLRGPCGIAHPPTANNQRPVRPHSLDQGGQPLLICLSVRPFDCRSSHMFWYSPSGIYIVFIQFSANLNSMSFFSCFLPHISKRERNQNNSYLHSVFFFFLSFFLPLCSLQ